MRVLHVVYECDPARHRGGVPKVVYELAAAQAELGHEVVIATLATDGAPYDSRHGGMTIRRFPAVLGLQARYSRKLATSLRKEAGRFDVVHTHNSYSPLNITAMRLARHWSAPLFVHSHGALDPVLLGGWSLKVVRKRGYIRLVESRLLRRAAAVFALSEQEATWLRGVGRDVRTVVVPNGIAPIGRASEVDVAAFRSRVGAHGHPLLLYVGRLNSKKNLALVFEVLATLRLEFPSIMLLICGSRTENPVYVGQLDEQCQRLQLDTHIRWAGFVDEIEKRSAYQSADVFLHSSISEGMPMAVIEAMAAGLPCVVTSGTMMTAAAASGAVLERDGVKPYSEAIACLLRSDASRRSLVVAACELIDQQYSWPRIAREVCAAYEAAQPLGA